ncbi:Cysteine/histidine-rich C1 domain protein [Quillaja saponaria]|uniref:Cysteine/histidine-rich C1 domain protein n=1 Tax=Quillaja saponaria TaxID=32244 RepID=A0AAD7LZA1_QUISA|nr:Cysteine/histidine-rich C1 domain protein [Quillaja saponaria]
MNMNHMMMREREQKALKKTPTFLLERAPSSINQPPNPKPTTTSAYDRQNSSNFPHVITTTFVPKRNDPRQHAMLEFPTSPQLVFGEELLHFNHPQHPLSKVNLHDLFTCSGCKEYGSGKRFICQQCDFQLHDFCALAPPALKAHPFHSQHRLLFYSRPVKGGIMKSKCDVCAKPTKGYAFRCSACGFQMHPCCAMLSSEINYLGHPHNPLRLLPAAAISSTTTTSPSPSNGIINSASASAAGSAGFMCGECKRRRSGRVYHCTECDYHLHAACAKNMVNGLQANGIKGPEKPSMLGTAARLATQVVIEFIGGLIEGIGEGVGEVFVQNIARGRRTTAAAARRS